MWVDAYGRTIDYLRISVTDRCNLRCVYCMPAHGMQWQPARDQLTVDEIARVAEAAAQGGVRRVRLTGGEPLVHPHIVQIVSRIAAIPGIEDVSLTTNAMLLERLAIPLAKAGLQRVNISLDTLDADKFRCITRGFGDIARVWKGIAAAEGAGLLPLKINSVIVHGLNSQELVPLARLTVHHAWHVRFIEIMPIGHAQDWGDGFPPFEARYMSTREMHAELHELGMHAEEGPTGNGPARTFRIPGALGTVGFISPLGEHFCGSCNRMRLTADGRLRPCLAITNEISLRDALRAGKPLGEFFQQAVSRKPERHDMRAAVHAATQRGMSQIGG